MKLMLDTNVCIYLINRILIDPNHNAIPDTLSVPFRSARRFMR